MRTTTHTPMTTMKTCLKHDWRMHGFVTVHSSRNQCKQVLNRTCLTV